MPAKTFAEMQELDQEYWKNAGNQAFQDLVHEQVNKCIADPEAHKNEPMTVLSALRAWDWNPVHQCYWNNRFVIAVMCNMPLWNKQRAAWAVICNGAIGYFEWKTHSGYKMADVFRYLGIEGINSPPHRNDYGYSRLSKSISDQLADMFNLPTVTFGKKKQLTEKECRFRDELNKLNSKLRLE